MNAELWKQVDALLDAALELPPEQREQFVTNACDGNEELRAEVLSLISAGSQASSFMERSAMKVAAQALAHGVQQAQDSNLTTHFSLIGSEIGTYRIEKLLGAGGMGEVYLARETKLNRRVALKILPPHFVADSERVKRFEREAQALSALNHPNLITIYEVGEVDEAGGLHFIAMEFVEGQTLRSTMTSAPKAREILSIIAQVAEALSAAHHAGIIHRDIKPDNIMVRADGYVKVLDFGLAKLTEPEPNAGSEPASSVAHTQAGVTMGTLAYMSPEQASGDAIDHRTDIWSLGVVLYELMTKQKPFRGATRQATVNAILSSEPNSATSSDPNLPSELDLVLEKALEKDRELRYQTASDFRADVRRLLRGMDSSPSSSRQRALAGLKQVHAARRWVWPSALAFAVVLAIIVGWIFLKQRPQAPDWSRATHIQLTEHPGPEFFPSLAPDGKSFVYASRSSDDFDLFLQRVGGKNPTLLTHDATANDTQPAFSPDGERIAFRSDRSPAGIYLMEATGENLRPVTAGGFHPSWSPDGKELVFSEAGRDAPDVRNTMPSKLWIVNVETGAKRLLTDSDAMQPAWSPSGHRIAFWFMPPSVGRSDIATVSRDGGEPLVITKEASTNWNPVWSPDGKYLYFASDRSGNMNFWRVAIDEASGKVLGEPEAVVTPSKFSGHLNFSRDGKRMIYVQTNNQSNIQAIEFDANRERASGEPFWITRGDRQISRPELSADGKRFVMRVPRRTQDDIALVSRDGSDWRDLTNDKFFDRYPRWSPDGRKIAFVSDRSGGYEIWMIDADGTNLKQVTFGGLPSTSFPLWSPDGTRLLFRTHPDSYVIDLSKTWQEQKPQALPPLAHAGDYFVAWDWSPDGKKLCGAFRGSGGEEVGYFSFETGRYEKVAAVDGQPAWLPDSRRFVFMNDGKALIADTETKKVREFFSHEPEQIRSIAVSRDGRLLYYTLFSSESDIWLLDLE